jgi:hypothetical protein
VIAIATSAGGLKALSQVLAALPPDFSPAIVVVQHLDPRHRSLMGRYPQPAEPVARQASRRKRQAAARDGVHRAAEQASAREPDGSLSLTPIRARPLRPALG